MRVQGHYRGRKHFLAGVLYSQLLTTEAPRMTTYSMGFYLEVSQGRSCEAMGHGAADAFALKPGAFSLALGLGTRNSSETQLPCAGAECAAQSICCFASASCCSKQTPKFPDRHMLAGLLTF